MGFSRGYFRAKNPRVDISKGVSITSPGAPAPSSEACRKRLQAQQRGRLQA